MDRHSNRLCSSSDGRCPESLTSKGLDKGVTGVIHHSLSLKLQHDKPRTFHFKTDHSLLRNPTVIYRPGPLLPPDGLGFWPLLTLGRPPNTDFKFRDS